jgi:hypothetical protein
MNLMDGVIKQLVQLFKLIDQGEYLKMLLHTYSNLVMEPVLLIKSILVV